MSPRRSTVRRIAAWGCLALVSMAAARASAADRFFSAIEDLPVMPALTEVPRSALVFSKAQGRIVEVAARGAVTRAAVLAFYRRTLPQLGWRGGEGDAWRRDGETLRIGFRATGRGLLVQFSIAPQ